MLSGLLALRMFTCWTECLQTVRASTSSGSSPHVPVLIRLRSASVFLRPKALSWPSRPRPGYGRLPTLAVPLAQAPDQGLTERQKWEGLFAAPESYVDCRQLKAAGKVSPRYPDFRHKETNLALWLPSRRPRDFVDWVSSGLSEVDAKVAKLPGNEPVQASHAKWAAETTEAKWRRFFEDPAQWFDMRQCKGNPAGPDFRHKNRRDVGRPQFYESLWLSGRFAVPSWVASQVAELDLEADPSRRPTPKEHAAVTTKAQWDAFFRNPKAYLDFRAAKHDSPQYPDFKAMDRDEALWLPKPGDPLYHPITQQLKELKQQPQQAFPGRLRKGLPLRVAPGLAANGNHAAEDGDDRVKLGVSIKPNAAGAMEGKPKLETRLDVTLADREACLQAVLGVPDTCGDEEAEPPEASMTVQLKTYQRLGLAWMLRQERGQLHGGFLADEQGLGKTISVIALLLSRPRPAHLQQAVTEVEASSKGSAADSSPELSQAKGTLIVLPLGLLQQWQAELQSKVAPDRRLRVHVHHGQHRNTADIHWLQDADVVLTTYDTLARDSPANAPEPTPLFQLHWWRVVLDEAHLICNDSTQKAEAAYGLQAEHRWCLSGTPLQNRPRELFSYMRFLGCAPYNTFSVFNDLMRTDGDPTQRLRAVLPTMMLRRTKQTTLNGGPILSLTTRTVTRQPVHFSDAEQQHYTELEENGTREAEEDPGFANILAKINVLRRACVHPSLVAATSLKPLPGSEALARLLEGDERDGLLSALVDSDGVCGSCGDTCEELLVMRCGHTCCPSCLATTRTDEALTCATCCTSYAPGAAFLESQLSGSNPLESSTGGGALVAPLSAKFEALLGVLDDIRAESGGRDKTLVFSQWVGVLDLLEPVLEQHGYGFVRIDGSMNQQRRRTAIERFEAPDIPVMLLSLRAASVGLNLVAANRVIFMDTWWNPAVEDQAIDRTHRIGQEKDVHVTKIYIEGTIEERIFALLDSKSEMARRVLGAGGDAAQAGYGKSHLSRAELESLFVGDGSRQQPSQQEPVAA